MEDAAPRNINDDQLVLELVLLRLPSSACLVRAAATCKLWRRLISDRGFLKLYRSLHPSSTTTTAGDYFNKRYRSPSGEFIIHCPTFVPCTTTTTSTSSTSFVSLDFLPEGPEDWLILDSRGSLLLTKNLRLDNEPYFPEMLVVCEPLTRRYTRITAPPGFESDSQSQVRGCYLIDGAADEAGGGGCRCVIGMSNFRVVLEVVHCDGGGVLRAAVFTVAAGVGGSWSERAVIADEKIARALYHRRFLGRAGDSRYYLVEQRTLVGFNIHTCEHSSSFELPTNEDWPDHVQSNPTINITDGRHGEPRMFCAVDNVLSVYGRLLDNNEWVLRKKVPLREATRGLPGYKSSYFNRPLFVLSVGPDFVILIAHARERWLFSIDLVTKEVSPASLEDLPHTLFPYEYPWPPVFNCLQTV